MDESRNNQITLQSSIDPPIEPFLSDNNDDNALESEIPSPPDLNQQLEQFRNAWKSELESKSENDGEVIKGQTSVGEVRSGLSLGLHEDSEDGGRHSDDHEAQALQYFKQGVLLEQRGKLYDAVAYYRRATQLVPDIELKMYYLEQKSSQSSSHGHSTPNSIKSPDDENKHANLQNNNSFHNDLDEDCNLFDRFLALSTQENEGNLLLCSPEVPQFMTHFSHIPYEVVVYILKWVISNELDLRSLEQFSRVCRGFYLVSRDPEFWRLACIKTWGSSIMSKVASYNNDFRFMYIERPHLNFNGAYISKTSYVRQGEPSFQDVHYRPCHIVEYYRYLRFFPDGLVLMLTTPDEPYSSLPSLRSRCPRNMNVLKGGYTFTGSTINIIVKKEYVESRMINKYNQKSSSYTKRREVSVTSSQTFYITLELKSSKYKKNNIQLCWIDYSVHFQRSNGHEMKSSFEIKPNAFPSFWFSRVKSFTQESESKLSSSVK